MQRRTVCRLLIAAIVVFVVCDVVVLIPQSRLTVLWAVGRAEGCSLAESLASIDALVRQAQVARPVRRLREEASFVLYETDLGQFWIPRRGRAIDQENMIHGLVRDQLADVYSGPAGGVRQGDVVIDCGANVGTFTRHALRKGARKVIMVEPSPENIEVLRRNFKTELDQGVVDLRPVAVWDRPDTLKFTLNFASAVDSAVYSHPGAMGSIQVEAQTLDQIGREEQRIDFIKLDVEGAEAKAILGVKELLRRARPRLAIEMQFVPLYEVRAAVRAARSDYSEACRCYYEGTVIWPGLAYFY